jgi:hypothetical protein
MLDTVDHLPGPLIPKTLSPQPHAQLRALLDGNRYRYTGQYAFFSFVEGRRRIHREPAAYQDLWKQNYEVLLDEPR